MTGLIRKATLLVVLALLATVAVATAGIPTEGNSLVPAFVNLVACDDLGNLPTGARFEATVTVKDVGNFPVVNAEISLSFCDDVRIYDAIPGGTVVCPVYTKTVKTDAAGQATVVISGAGFNVDGTTVGTDGADCVSWYADTYFIGTSHVSTYDEDGCTDGAKEGVFAADLTSCLKDKVGLPYSYRPRSDLNNNIDVDAGDLTYLLQYKVAIPSFALDCGDLCINP
jgi:hypothetical protein